MICKINNENQNNPKNTEVQVVAGGSWWYIYQITFEN